jgi:hypothetical protein
MISATIHPPRAHVFPDRIGARTLLSVVAVLALVFAAFAAPAPAHAASHPIGSYEKYPWSSTLYRVGTPYTATAVTYAQWQAAGFPGYTTTLVLGSSVQTYLTHSEEIFIGPFVDDTHPRVDWPHHVAAAEWAAVGYPAARSAGVGFIKTASNPNIYLCTANATSATVLTYTTWQHYGSPTPVVVSGISARCP